jgi:hypothetical protein
MQPHDEFENEWTAEERAQLDTLSADRIPPAALKARTIASLERDGWLRPRRSLPLRATLGLLAAAAVVFAAGAVVGYSLADRRSAPRTTEDRVLPREVARADSAATTTTVARHVVWF